MAKKRKKKFSADGFLAICNACGGEGATGRRFYELAGEMYEVAGGLVPRGARVLIECCQSCKGSGVMWRGGQMHQPGRAVA